MFKNNNANQKNHLSLSNKNKEHSIISIKSNKVCQQQQQQKITKKSQKYDEKRLTKSSLTSTSTASSSSSSKTTTPKTAVLNRNLINANWQNFIMTTTTTTTPAATMTTIKNKSFTAANANNYNSKIQRNNNVDGKILTTTNAGDVKLTKYIAMDCEMVGIGYLGKKHMLARVSIVNQYGDIIYDKYVRPTEQVIDYRTSISGIRPENILSNTAIDYKIVQKDVENLLKNRILIGHAVHNDLKVLQLTHMKRYTRDTSKYKPLLKLLNSGLGSHYGKTPSLKTLTNYILGYDIQLNEHSSIEDARATMEIYNKYSRNWEHMIRQRDLS